MTTADLVVGGAGFIGSHLALALEAKGNRVRVLDNFSTGKPENLKGFRGETVAGDAADISVALEACKDVDRIFHLAARASVPFSVEFPEEAKKANYGTTLALLSAAEKNDIKRFVFSSSSAVYGESPELPKREDMKPNPVSPYAEHKLAGEAALAAVTSAMTCVSLRYFNVFGPKQDHSSPYSGVVSLFARLAYCDEPASVYGDGTQTRDFVFVDDVVRANLLAGDLKTEHNASVFNIGTGTPSAVIDIWSFICELSGREKIVPNFLPARSGDIQHSVCDPQRATTDLGFTATTSLRDGLASTLVTN